MALSTGCALRNPFYLHGAGSRLAARRPPTPIDDDRALRRNRRDLNIGLCVPLGGLTGIWGPSALASAQLAGAELNRAAGIDGRPCRLIAVDADANIAFEERYHGHFGERAPTLNSLGQSTYEGVHFLASLFEHGPIQPAHWGRAGRPPMPYRSTRDAVYLADGTTLAPTYIAVAEGNCFRVIDRL